MENYGLTKDPTVWGGDQDHDGRIEGLQAGRGGGLEVRKENKFKQTRTGNVSSGEDGPVTPWSNERTGTVCKQG